MTIFWRSQASRFKSVPSERITEARGNRRSGDRGHPVPCLPARWTNHRWRCWRETHSTSARQLTDEADPVVKCTIEQALTKMSADYDVVAKVVRSVAAVWGESSDRFDRLERPGSRPPRNWRCVPSGSGGRTSSTDARRATRRRRASGGAEDPLSLASEATVEIESVVGAGGAAAAGRAPPTPAAAGPLGRGERDRGGASGPAGTDAATRS